MDEWGWNRKKPGAAYEFHATSLGHLAEEPVRKGRDHYRKKKDDIADRCRICEACVLPDCMPNSRRCVLKKEYRPRRSERREQAVALYRAGKAIQEIADEMGVTRNTVYEHLKREGIPYEAQIGRPKRKQKE